jgi:hypothetical protein
VGLATRGGSGTETGLRRLCGSRVEKRSNFPIKNDSGCVVSGLSDKSHSARSRRRNGEAPTAKQMKVYSVSAPDVCAKMKNLAAHYTKTTEWTAVDSHPKAPTEHQIRLRAKGGRGATVFSSFHRALKSGEIANGFIPESRSTIGTNLRSQDCLHVTRSRSCLHDVSQDSTQHSIYHHRRIELSGATIVETSAANYHCSRLPRHHVFRCLCRRLAVERRLCSNPPIVRLRAPPCLRVNEAARGCGWRRAGRLLRG